ncbi:MAG: hypothetical protein Kow009_02160 [Spirochaetales bacterium]
MRVSTLVGWILVGLYTAAFGYSQESLQVSVSVPPGEYSRDITLVVTPLSPSIQVFYRFTDSSDPSYIPYRIPLVLSALKGEERQYELEYQVYDGKNLTGSGRVIYRIDKRPPRVPVPSLDSGEYRGSRLVTFEKEPDTDVFFAVHRGEKPEFLPWDGKPIALESSPNPTTVTLLYYAQDRAGNKSRVESRTYTLLPEAPPLDAFWKVLSPTEGNFLNPQVLWIEHRGYEWIKYRINDASVFQTYQHPIVLTETGVVKVEITAKRLYSPDMETKVITFRQEAHLQEGLPPSKVYSLEEEISFRLGKGTYRYNLEDRAVESYDPETPDRLSFYPVEGHNRIVVIRLKPASSPGEGEYRYLLELKGELPGDVAIRFDRSGVYRDKAVVTLEGRPGAEIYYTLDGSLPTLNSLRYEGPFEVPLPPRSEGFLTIRARARMGQYWGPVAEKYQEYDTVPPPVPNPRIHQDNPASYARIELPPIPDGEGIFEIAWDGNDPPPPSLHSPLLDATQWIRVPYGYAGTATLRIAYRDRAGNITESPEPLSISFDRSPPPAPRISLKDKVLSLEGEGTLFCRIEERTGSLDPGEASGMVYDSYHPYTGPVELPALEGKLVQYRILAYAEDKAGNRSETTLPYDVSFDRRIPTTILPVQPKPATQIPITNKEFLLSFPDPRGDLELYYNFTEDGTEPPDPDSSSLKGASALRFYGQPGKRIHYTVKVWARYRGSLETGQIQTFQFIIDREPPELPKIEGITPSVRNRGALVRFIPAQPEDRVFYRLSTAPDGKSTSWIPYTQPFLLDGEEGREVQYTLTYRVEDDAGNSVEGPAPITLMIDRKPPRAPVVEVQKDIRLHAEEGRIYYELTGNGSLPPFPTETSPQYIRELPRSGDPGSFLSLAARTRDDAGNWSEVVFVTDIPSLPGSSPRTPPVHVRSLGEFTILSWDETGSDPSMEGLDPQAGFDLRTLDPPWILETSKEREVLVQSRNDLGNEGNPVTVRIVPPPTAIPVRIRGGEKGEYAQGIQLENLEDSAILRFEVSTGETPPRTVSPLSPRMERSLTLDALPEETVSYRIQVQNYSKDNIPLSPAQEFTVKIDRTPPPPPVLSGVEEGVSYGEDVTATLHAKEGIIFYVLDSTEEGKGPPAFPSLKRFNPYEKPIPASVPEGVSREFYLTAFTRDSVGNISRKTPRWFFALDKQYLYVTEGEGKGGRGTRISPFTDLETALEAASKGSRTRIRLATGAYRITRPVHVKRNLQLLGGFDRNGWKPEVGTSTIRLEPSRDWKSDDMAYFTVEGVALNVQRCRFEGGDGAGRTMFVLRDGKLQFSSGSITVVGKDRILDQWKGEVFLDGSEFGSSRMDGSFLLKVSEGTFLSSQSRFSYQRSERGGSLLRFEKASATLESSSLAPGSGETTLAIDGKDSRIRIQSSTIQTGEGTLVAYGLRVQGGSLQMEGSEIQHTPAAYISIGIGLLESRGEIAASTFKTGGRYGAQVLKVRSSELTLQENLFEGVTTADYLYYGTFEDSSLRLIGNVFRKGSSADFTAFQILNSRMEAERNIFQFGTSARGFIGFMLKGKSDLVLQNNEIFAPDPKGILFILPGENVQVSVTGNRFQVEGAYRESWKLGRKVLLKTLQELEESSTNQVRFEGNRN